MVTCMGATLLLGACGGQSAAGVATDTVAVVSAVAPTATPTPTPTMAASAAAPTVTQAAPGFLGVNLTAVAYYSGDRPFMNLLVGSGWVDSNAGWSPLPAAQIDRTGNVTALKAGQVAVRILTPPASSLSGDGATIRCSWTGTGVIKAAGTRKAGSDVYGDHSVRFFMPTFTTGSWTWLELRSIDAADPIRNLDCREADADPQAVFAPEFVDALKPFGVLRFMDWAGVNDNPANPQWADRTQEGGLSQRVVAWEHMAKLAAMLNVDAWYNVPYDVQEDYAVRLGRLIHDLTPAGRKVYVELGNEVWNYGFKNTTQAREEGGTEGLDPNNTHRAALLRYAEKTTWLMKLWTPIFADHPGQLVRVAATQNANPWSAEQVLGFRDTAQWVDAIATAPYFGLPSLATNTDAAATLLPLLAPSALAVLADTATKNADVAKRYGKRFLAYEAGQHLVDANNVARLTEVNRSAEMGNAYRSYIADWKARFGDTMMLFASTGVISQYGAWGLRERAGQPAADAPKYRAAVEFGR